MTEPIKVPSDIDIKIASKMGRVQAKLKFDPALGPGANNAYKRAQKFVDSEVIRLSSPYTPMRSGKLIQSSTSSTRIGSGEVKYNAPYARYQYYGMLMVGRAPKKLTSTPLKYQGAPQRGAKWFERMKAKNKTDILKGAGKIVATKK